jgi:hypothetical protein
MEMSKDKSKLREDRLEAAKIRKKLALGNNYKTELFKGSEGTTSGGTGGSTGPASRQKMMVVDEDAFFNYHEKKSLQKNEEMDEKSSPEKSYDKQTEPNLFKKLGLEKETDQTIVKKEGSKKSKEDLEKEVLYY